MNICMSHSSVIRLIDKLGHGHDAVVEKWRDTLQSELKVPKVTLVKLNNLTNNNQFIPFHM